MGAEFTEEMPMVRGCRKKVIHLRNTESDLFEEAFLILKEKSSGLLPERDMVKEANRILSQSEVSGAPAESSARRRFFGVLLGSLCFLAGACSGAAACLLLCG